MGLCVCCGNDYDKSFEIEMAGNSYTFDSFECASCAAQFGMAGLRDRI